VARGGVKTTAAKLFHAVVVSGAALTASCGKTDVPIDAAATPELDAAAEKDSGPDTSAPAADGGTDSGCPPGSELPMPPCYYIR
jgi:hypothetical protein